MKNYLKDIIDLTGDSYLNPSWSGHTRNVNSITSISIHHDASFRPHSYDSVARYRQEAAYHYNNLGPGLQYHYKIDNVGQIFKIRNHEMWLYTVGTQENVTSISICLDGYFHPDVNQIPTREQYEALSQLAIELSDNHPEFPATYPDVRPHSDYSSTACPGNNLRPYVLQIRDKASAQNIPDVPYDWPELQTTAPAPQPAPLPAPAPVTTPPTNILPIQENITTATYVAQVNTHLDDILTGNKIKDFAPGTTFDMSRRIKYQDRSWLVTVYSASKNILNGIPEKDLILQNTGTPIPPEVKPTPTPPVPETPPVVKPKDQTDSEKLSLILQIVQWIKDLLGKIFNIK